MGKIFVSLLGQNHNIDDPSILKTWNRDENMNFINKKCFHEKILCQTTKKKIKKAPEEYDTSDTCYKINNNVKNRQFPIIIPEEKYYRTSLDIPKISFTCINRENGEDLLTVDSLEHIPESQFQHCKLTTKEEKAFLIIKSGIIINENHLSTVNKHLTVDKSNELVLKKLPVFTPDAIRRLIKNILLQRKQLDIKDKFYDITPLSLRNKNLPQNLSIGLLHLRSTIFGSFNINDSMFGEKNQVTQILTSLYVANCFIKIVAIDEWSSRTLDDILIAANDNYAHFQDDQIFRVKKYCVKFDNAQPIIIGRLNVKELNIFNVYQGFYLFFQKYKVGLFHSEHTYLLIYYHNNIFYIFDPMGRLENLTLNQEYGLSVLIKLKNLCNLTYFILNLCNLKSSSPFTISEIQTCKITCTLKPQKKVEDEQKDVDDNVFDLDYPDEFVTEHKKISTQSINDGDLSDYNLVKWNIDKFKNETVVSKYVDQFLIEWDKNYETDDKVYIGHLVEDIVNCAFDFIYFCHCDDSLNRCGEPKEQQDNATIVKATKSHFIDLSNGVSILLTKRIQKHSTFYLSALLSFIFIKYKYPNLYEWNSQYLDYAIETSIQVYPHFKITIENFTTYNHIHMKLKLGLNLIYLKFIKLASFFYEELKDRLKSLLVRNNNLLFIVHRNYAFVIVQENEYYYLFDGGYYNAYGLREYNQSKKGLYHCIICFKTNLNCLLEQIKLFLKPDENLLVFKVEQIKIDEFEKKEMNFKCFLPFKKTDFDGLYKIQGSSELSHRNIVDLENLKSCYFTSIYIVMFLLRIPLSNWSSQLIDLAIKNGLNLFDQHRKSKEGLSNFYEKREICNLLIDGYVYDIILKKFVTLTKNFTLHQELIYYFSKRNIVIIKFNNCSFVLHKDKFFYLFDSYRTMDCLIRDDDARIAYADCMDDSGTQPIDGERNTASWVLFRDLRNCIAFMTHRIVHQDQNSEKVFSLWTIDITRFQRSETTKGIELPVVYYDDCKQKIPEFNFDSNLNSAFDENKDWLKKSYYIQPWSRLLIKYKQKHFDKKSILMWNNFEVEIEREIFSLWGNIHPKSYVFKSSANKQYFGIYVIALLMANLYHLPFWTEELIDQIIIEGDKYFNKSTAKIATPNHEMKITDLLTKYRLNEISFELEFILPSPNHGVLYELKKNLSKFLLNFFNSNYKYGVLQCRDKIICFGCDEVYGFFMFDAQSYGYPLFLDNQGCGYMLISFTLNRLIYMIVMTLMNEDDNQPFSVCALQFSIRVSGRKYIREYYEQTEEKLLKLLRIKDCVDKRNDNKDIENIVEPRKSFERHY